MDIGPGQVGSRVTHQLHNVGRVGVCMGRVGSEKKWPMSNSVAHEKWNLADLRHYADEASIYFSK